MSPGDRTAECWTIAKRVSRYVPYSSEDCFLLAVRAWDQAGGNIERAEAITAVACRIAQTSGARLNEIRLKPIVAEVEKHPRPSAILNDHLEHFRHADGCACFTCSAQRVRDALRGLVKAIWKSVKGSG